MSVAMFMRPDDEPEFVPDSHLDLDHGPDKDKMPRDEKLEAKSQTRTHFVPRVRGRK